MINIIYEPHEFYIMGPSKVEAIEGVPEISSPFEVIQSLP